MRAESKDVPVITSPMPITILQQIDERLLVWNVIMINKEYRSSTNARSDAVRNSFLLYVYPYETDLFFTHSKLFRSQRLFCWIFFKVIHRTKLLSDFRNSFLDPGRKVK